MVFIAAICLFAFLRLVETQLKIGGSYGDMGARLWPTRGGRILRITVLFFICISQMGFVASYTIFISQNLYDVVNALSNCASPIQEKYYIWMPLVVIIPFALIRRIAKLSFAAIIADILILYGIICVIYFTSDQLYHNGVGPGIKLINPNNFALMIGTATFSFEGIGLGKCVNRSKAASGLDEVPL
jgi:amino acid permease